MGSGGGLSARLSVRDRIRIFSTLSNTRVRFRSLMLLRRRRLAIGRAEARARPREHAPPQLVPQRGE